MFWIKHFYAFWKTCIVSFLFNTTLLNIFVVFTVVKRVTPSDIQVIVRVVIQCDYFHGTFEEKVPLASIGEF